MSEMFLPVKAGTPKPEVNRAPPEGLRKYPLETMLVGTAFFIPNRTVKATSSYLARLKKTIPDKVYSSRRSWGIMNDNEWSLVDEGTPEAVEGVSVWRDE